MLELSVGTITHILSVALRNAPAHPGGHALRFQFLAPSAPNIEAREPLK
jgi:hypothetical protein